jgi:hypothetical protein
VGLAGSVLSSYLEDATLAAVLDKNLILIDIWIWFTKICGMDIDRIITNLRVPYLNVDDSVVSIAMPKVSIYVRYEANGAVCGILVAADMTFFTASQVAMMYCSDKVG